MIFVRSAEQTSEEVIPMYDPFVMFLTGTMTGLVLGIVISAVMTAISNNIEGKGNYTEKEMQEAIKTGFDDGFAFAKSKFERGAK